MNRRIAGTVLMAMIVVLGGCARKPAGLESVATAASKNSGNVAPWGIDLSSAPGTKFQATFADDVVQVDAGTVKRTLRGVTRDHDILFFDNVPELRDKLVPGKVVLFQGFTFKRVQAIASDGAQLIVAAEPAALRCQLRLEPQVADPAALPRGFLGRLGGGGASASARHLVRAGLPRVR